MADIKLTLRSSRPAGRQNGLTNDEIDGNFVALKQAVEAIEPIPGPEGPPGNLEDAELPFDPVLNFENAIA